MNTNKDFGLLWKQQKVAAIPNMKEITKQANKVKSKMRTKSLLTMALAIFAIAYYTFFMVHFQPKLITTWVGAFLMLLAIIFYQVFSISILPLLIKDNSGSSNKEYLQMMILLKQKQNFFNKIILNIFFAALAVGLLLFMTELATMLSIVWIVALYTVALGWLVFTWTYIRPRKIRKQTAELNETIHNLEKIDRQINKDENQL